MFVSSYNTYIDTTTTKRIQNDKDTSEKKVSKLPFESKLSQEVSKDVNLGKNIPLNYISNYKSLNNQQKLSHQTLDQNKSKMKFTKLSAMDSASVAYTTNTKMFSLIQKPKQTIDQTPRLDRNLSMPAQEKQESFMRNKMINTYVSNENYYRITAA